MAWTAVVYLRPLPWWLGGVIFYVPWLQLIWLWAKCGGKRRLRLELPAWPTSRKSLLGLTFLICKMRKWLEGLSVIPQLWNGWLRMSPDCRRSGAGSGRNAALHLRVHTGPRPPVSGAVKGKELGWSEHFCWSCWPRETNVDPLAAEAAVIIRLSCKTSTTTLQAAGRSVLISEWTLCGFFPASPRQEKTIFTVLCQGAVDFTNSDFCMTVTAHHKWCYCL